MLPKVTEIDLSLSWFPLFWYDKIPFHFQSIFFNILFFLNWKLDPFEQIIHKITNNICLKFPELSSILCDFPWLFWSVQNSLTFPWLENAFSFFQVFQSEWEPWSLQKLFCAINSHPVIRYKTLKNYLSLLAHSDEFQLVNSGKIYSSRTSGQVLKYWLVIPLKLLPLIGVFFITGIWVLQRFVLGSNNTETGRSKVQLFKSQISVIQPQQFEQLIIQGNRKLCQHILVNVTTHWNSFWKQNHNFVVN